MHSAEEQLAHSLGEMAEAARSPRLRQALEAMGASTRAQLDRMADALEALDAGPGEEDCEAMEGLIAEVQELLDEDMEGPILDAAMIVAMQKIAHYQISGYGSLAALAQACGEEGAAGIFHALLEEERGADSQLNAIAVEEVNPLAARAQGADT